MSRVLITGANRGLGLEFVRQQRNQKQEVQFIRVRIEIVARRFRRRAVPQSGGRR